MSTVLWTSGAIGGFSMKLCPSSSGRMRNTIAFCVLPEAKPHRMLAYLLREKDMKPSDLWDILPKSRVSEILGGKRQISKAQAKQLAARFDVPVDLFV